MVLLLAAAPLCPMRGLSSTSVPELILAFFLGGAAAAVAAVAFVVLGFNVWCF
jgi:hypothetical protein